jgi:hypothetical protein
MKPKKKSYSSNDILKLGIKRERLKEWLFKGYFSPSIQEASGPGTKNLYSHLDLYFIKLFQELVEQGFARQVVAARIASVRDIMNTVAGIEQKQILAIVQFEGINQSESVDSEWFFLDLNELQSSIDSYETNFKNALLINFRAICEKVDDALDNAE